MGLWVYGEEEVREGRGEVRMCGRWARGGWTMREYFGGRRK